MRDMFIQSQQQLVQSNNTAAIPKKRKAEYCFNEQFAQQEPAYKQDSVNNQLNASLGANNASPGNQQPFVRASTIKLLNTYQRCGQKVSSDKRRGWKRQK